MIMTPRRAAPRRAAPRRAAPRRAAPKDASVKALLRDARFFLLPDTITINNETHQVGPVAVLQHSHEALMRGIAAAWDGFDQCLEGILAECCKAYDKAVEASKTATSTNDYGQEPVHVIPLGTETRWGVFNRHRLEVLTRELSKYGFKCQAWTRQNNSTYKAELRLCMGKDSTPETQRVKLEGVDTYNGRLIVETRADGRNGWSRIM